MKDINNEAKIRARETYNSAADHFDDLQLGFWDRYGRKTVERLSLSAGSEVLDVACGTGASAIPAAEIVGPEGSVTGIDLAENPLQLARCKALRKNLTNIEFINADMENSGFPDGKFDAVVCVFGIFFVPDMERQVGELWRLVKPGGKLAITTWGTGFFAPAYDYWKQLVRKERPELYSAYNPWDRITDKESVLNLMKNGGTSNIEVAAEEGVQSLRNPEDWWIIALGSGLRWTIDQLSPDEAEKIRGACISWIIENNIDSVGTDVIYAVAGKDET